LHIIVNNQIGFTATPAEGRSSIYATGIARMLQSPLFHVNGEDPEAVAQVVRLAMEFRREFGRDVFIDMYGYRRLGHNESDEPAFTQPVLYNIIAKRKSVREGYLEHLLSLNDVTPAEADEILAKRREALEKELSESQQETKPAEEPVSGIWAKYVGGPEAQVQDVPTGAPKNELAALLEDQTKLPENFQPHPKIKKFLDSRKKMAAGEEPLDWSAAEALAFASLAAVGFRIRLTGQDSERGTFSQRHSVLHDFTDGHTYTPLQHLSTAQAPVEIVNSPLSESGVLGFEYGYSMDYPDGLVLWEAQFGDFCNVAQPIIDQFISSGENKWHRLSGLVLLLPHGSEGQGPEHTSARLERFLSLAAEDNIQIVYPTTPAQYFHLLRRQALRPWRKPLIVMTPKSLLRHPKCVSSLDELATGHFQRIMPDVNGQSPEKVKRVLLCSGKIYYELDGYREETNHNDVAILRIEQLYPLPPESLHDVLKIYPDGTPVFWVQEEPKNMGGWRELRINFGDKLFDKYPLAGISRPPSPSPASGSAKRHKQEQSEIIKRAFGDK
ncbi:MAG TPA: 2-oxoglutarate dehydrogenase E1 component, partial [Verrucomicrobiae bacterium]|nr:2-oxoglutarate dehydrogenase E1 component [Verrucomicrobiae bacterium]